MDENDQETGYDKKDIIEIRKDKIIKFLKKPEVWVIGLLIVAIILGVYIRSLPMQDHGGRPGLWDITTNSWTLGPDLDPWLFTRMAKLIVNEGSIPEIDTFRNVPLGFETSKETVLLPYMISWTYKISKIFYSAANVEFGAALLPVVMFGLTIIAFFLFVREIFSRKSKQSKRKGNIIALISTFLMIVIPVFLSRTIAGIPEKESPAFFFLFLALFLFLKAWKSEKIKHALILGILAGIATAGMALVSGLFIYIYLTIFISCFIAFVLNKFKKKEIIVYSSWWISAAIFIAVIPGKIDFKDLLTNLTLGPAFFLFILLLIHLLVWRTKLSENKFLRGIKLPKTIISILIAIVLFLIGSLILDLSFIFDKIEQINKTLFKATTGRWNTTVAENRQPYFTGWVNNFGPFFKKIPVMFWLFFAGSVVLFKNMIKKIKKKDSWKLTGLYVFFLMGLMFSRYSSSSLFNGENFISKFFFLLSIVLLFGFFVYYYIKYNKEGNKSFEKINYSYLLLLSLFILTLFTARSAIRLIMFLGPIVTIFVGYLIFESIKSFRKNKDEFGKIFLGLIVILILISSIFVFFTYYNSIKVQAYNTVPSAYHQQWQKAMQWVRDNTPEDSVFSHWWDYGYWVQSIGNRATVLDGGNAISFWNYYMGRLVLTGDNQEDALEFLYNHDANYLLIDSSDIGKYGAFSSIGSNENYDRLSFIPAMNSDPKENRETNKGLIRFYLGGVGLDEDIIYNLEDKQIFLPSGGAGLGGVSIEISQEDEIASFNQPVGIFVYNGIQHNIPLRYLEYNNEFIDFGVGLEGTVKIIQKINIVNGGVQVDDMGSIIYLSPRVMKGYLAQKYLLNDPLNKFPNFKLVHSENSLIVDSLKNQGLNLNEFVYYQGIQGPIKIWEIEYTGNEQERPEYLDKDPTKYLSWEL